MAKVAVASPGVSVGSMIDSVCGKCKRVTSHRVARKVGARPTLMECSVCAGLHGYKSPVASARAKKNKEQTAATSATPEERWLQAMKRAGGSPVAYAASGYFPVGQRLSHSAFGDGVVTSRASGTVCTVIFQCGEKKLLMASPNRPADEAPNS
jgi:hypothetical protein